MVGSRLCSAISEMAQIELRSWAYWLLVCAIVDDLN